MGTKSPTVDSAHQEGQLLQQAVEFVTSKGGDTGTEKRPVTGIILGSGLGGLADQILDPVVLRYEDIPGFCRLICGGASRRVDSWGHRGCAGHRDGGPISSV